MVLTDSMLGVVLAVHREALKSVHTGILSTGPPNFHHLDHPESVAPVERRVSEAVVCA